jgi:lipopolysaccharide export system permease protein
MWLSTFVLVPIGIFLITKAINDSQVFNKEYYFRTIKRFRTALSKPKEKIQVKET